MKRILLTIINQRRNTMSFQFLNQLPSPAEIIKEYPLPEKLVQIKKERDAAIRDVLTG